MNHQPFTDEDLKRLKEELENDPDAHLYPDLHNLVNRLEAAEVRGNTWALNAKHNCHGETCACCVADKEWRKAAGK